MIDLLSGMPNPAWTLSCEEAAVLSGLVRDLVPATGAAPSPPGLGYRGLVVSTDCAGLPAGTWRVFGGAIHLTDGVMTDADRHLERALLASGEGRVEARWLAAAREAIR
ncbi:hypothetical protein [Phreatobacter sp.]|uniref:hypothetical protein n=1 Tax=Phreatobacter sp. TaxID=1966341 RepID=UPI002624003C|nr:hypothetical protein [Phreatobacter sp.]